jgi:hypothetical protein
MSLFPFALGDMQLDVGAETFEPFMEHRENPRHMPVTPISLDLRWKPPRRSSTCPIGIVSGFY